MFIHNNNARPLDGEALASMTGPSTILRLFLRKADVGDWCVVPASTQLSNTRALAANNGVRRIRLEAAVLLVGSKSDPWAEPVKVLTVLETDD